MKNRKNNAAAQGLIYIWKGDFKGDYKGDYI